jgi:hypothetical protein
MNIRIGVLARMALAATCLHAAALGQIAASLEAASRPAVTRPTAPAPAGAPVSQPMGAINGPARPVTTQPAMLRVGPTTFDFGRIWSSDKLHHTFEMTNTGKRPVAILDVQTSCGCTRPKDYARQVAPGQKWELPIDFLPAGTIPGRVSKPIVVITDDSGMPRVVFHVKAEVAARLDFKPNGGAVVFGTIERDAVVRKTVTITNAAAQPVMLKKASVDTDALKVNLRQIEAGRTYELDVETVPPLKVTNFGGKITIETDLENMPVIYLATIGFVHQRVSMNPRLVVIPTPPLTGEVRRKMIVKAEKGATFHIKEVTVANPQVHTQVETVREGSEYRVWLTVPPGRTVTKAAKITVTTDDPQIPELGALLTPAPALKVPPGMEPRMEPDPQSPESKAHAQVPQTQPARPARYFRPPLRWPGPSTHPR